MKLDKRILVIIAFIGALGLFLLITGIITGFHPDLKDIITAVYFAVWVGAVAGFVAYIIYPYIQGRSREKAEKQTKSQVQATGPVPSPRPSLPLRDRIREYVTERRREEGLPVPEPLRPSRTGAPARSRPVSAASGREPGGDAALAAVPAVAAVAAETGDLPLPDDFDESGGEDIFGGDFPDEEGEEASLPDLDEDLGSFDDSESGESPSESGDLPGFDGDLEPDLSESDLSGSDVPDSMMDMDESDLDASEPEPSGQEEEGGLSDEGLPDFDMALDDDMMDGDLSGDDDLTDIQFEDLEPDET